MDKYLGKRLDGRYEIHELIGVGGMANVYRCTDTVDDREVAVKILKDEYLNNEEFIRRFKNESKAIAMLSHPNIVKVYDVSFGDMIQYIVMEYIDGITLKEYIDQQGIIEWKDAIHLTAQILKALQHAHECGIVHRDIKPQNIMLLQDGTIKVTDFGIARFSDKSTRTMTEQAIGSVHYIAPEQARGDATDGKTDIYSVGVMLYEMLTGKLPFDGDSAVTIALMQLQSTPKHPREINPGIPIGLEQITMKAMEKLPSDRYTSAAEMLSDIERFRLNPSIVFDYGNKSFVDNQPTKFVHSLRDGRVRNKIDNEATKVVDMPQDDVVVKEEQFADEDFVKEHKPSYYAVKGIVIAAVAVCAIFFALAMFRGCSTSQAKDVEVPDYVGKSFVSIKENNPNDFKFEVKSEYDESKEMGVILDQEPKGGSMKVKSGSTITVTVNGTDTEVSVPYVTNYSEKEASQALKEKNLIPEIVYVENTKTPKGYTIECFPKAGVKTTIGSTVYVYIASGERTKQVTLPSVDGLMLSEANFLILDEPTNHLDIASKEILEEALNNYTGTILYVSHDRYFINSTASRILELVNQTFVNYIGNYDYYLEKKDELTQTYASSQIQRQVSTSQNGSETLPADGAFLSDSKLSWQEQKEQQAKERKRKSELKKTEDEIALLENRNGEIDFQMTLEEVYSNSVKCQELSTERTKNELRLEELYEKWGELAE